MKINSLDLIGRSLSPLSLPARGSQVIPILDGQLAVDGEGMYRFDGSEWIKVTDFFDRPLFPFSEHVFTSAGLSGPTGPTQASLVAAYTAGGAAPWASNSAFFSAVNGIQKFVIPETARYSFTLIGALPLANDSRIPRRCVATVFADLIKGDVISILVGQRAGALWHGGTGDYTGCQVGAASGGTFVESANMGLIAVAGGQVLRTSGFTYTERTANGVPGDYSTNAGVVTQSTVPLGNGGIAVTQSRNGGVPAIGGGGGGYNTDGEGVAGGKSFKNGGNGGVWTGTLGNLGTVTSSGGFGGGAAAVGSTETNSSNRSAYASGGGGGYTGGNGSAGTVNVSGYLPGNGGSWVYSTVNGSANISAVSMDAPNASVRVTKVA